MPKVNKTGAKKANLKAFAKQLTPMQLKRAKALIRFAKKVTPQGLINASPKSKNLLQTMKKNKAIKQVRLLEAAGKINLNQPIMSQISIKKNK